MKFATYWESLKESTSLPVRGAWIEMMPNVCDFTFALSLPVRGAWIEMDWSGFTRSREMSLPVRGAWIEILALRY